MPWLSVEQMRDVDRLMAIDFGITLERMMENAGSALSRLVRRMLGGDSTGRSVVVLAGPGGNGGGGLVAARHLANHGVDVSVVLSAPGRMGEVPQHQLDVVERMGIAIHDEPHGSDLVIDAILGYSLQGDPRGRAAALIDWCLDRSEPVCALDTPSGLDVTTGEPRTPCVHATGTLTLALPKVGLAKARSHVGELFVGDISVPPLVYWGLGLSVPDDLFADGSIVRLG